MYLLGTVRSNLDSKTTLFLLMYIYAHVCEVIVFLIFLPLKGKKSKVNVCEVANEEIFRVKVRQNRGTEVVM